MDATIKPPDLLTAFDGEWSYYVGGHDEGELFVVDDPSVLQWEKVWMRPIPEEAAEDNGLWLPDDPTPGATCWIECASDHPEAQPFIGVKYAPRD